MFKEFLIYGGLLVVGAILWSLVPDCTPNDRELITVFDSTSIWKQQVKQDLKQIDSLKTIASKKDSVRIVEVPRWYEKKKKLGDISKLPCDSIIKYIPELVNDCDSIITHDTEQISVLNDVIKEQGFVIANQRKVINADSTRHVNDSLQFKAAKKEIKKQKTLKNVFKGTTILAAFLTIFI